MPKVPCCSFSPSTDCSFLLDAKGLILSVSQNRSSDEAEAHQDPRWWIGRSYFDFCTGPAAGIVRTELQNLLAGKARHFTTIYDCSSSDCDVVPIALIGSAFEVGTNRRFNLRHIVMNYGWVDTELGSLETRRVSQVLKQFFADPTRDRGALMKDEPTLRALEHLFASLENIRASMDEASFCQDNGSAYRRLAQLLIHAARVTDALVAELSPTVMSKN